MRFGSMILSAVLLLSFQAQSQLLKSVVYDFDGLDVNANSLPEGDYGFADLTYKVVPNPLASNDMIGDRVLQLNLNWSAGYGAFGRGISRYIQFDPNTDKFNFFFYNPLANNQDATFEIMLADDDNQDNVFNFNSDDSWKKSFTVPGSAGWQLLSVPLKDLVDGNPGGNGVFDMTFTGNKGMLLVVEFRFSKTTNQNATFYLDMISFSDGDLPTGPTVFDLPSKNPGDYALLGAYKKENPGQYHLIPGHVESLFPSVPGKKLKYVNFFMAFGTNGSTTPNNLPGSGLQTLIDQGYTPVLTWEPLFEGYARLDPVQPRLNNIINGQYNSYFDNFADQLKQINGTVIIRLMHEFEGDWYPWGLHANNKDPAQYVTAFRTIVNRVRARGVTNVLWMWCVNGDYAPYTHYNWVVPAYPGNDYVDIVATDVYNTHYPISLPWWMSFRYKAAESYYYLVKYFSNKPLFICEVGCRERFASENPASESKGAWYARMDKELQSNYHMVRALIFFNGHADQNWLINSSPGALQSLIDNFWYDNYYFNATNPIGVDENEQEYGKGLWVHPNPNNGLLTLSYNSSVPGENFEVRIINAAGQVVHKESIPENTNTFTRYLQLNILPKGIYLVELEIHREDKTTKQVRKLVLE